MTPTLAALADFPDRLSPMLVKELRQGLRARTFIVVFLTLQALLAIILLTASGAADSDKIGIIISRIIFIFFSVAVLLVQPLRGMNAVHSEIKGRTIDLMMLSRLSAWRIVLGKWVAIVSQSALLLAAILPYLVLRYFFGRMNLFGELSLLAAVFCVSMFFTAVTVGLSAIPSVLIRAVLPLIGMPLLMIYILGVFMSPFFQETVDIFTFSTPEAKIGVPLVAAILFYLGWTALGLAAGLVAPPAENHSTVRRLVALAIMLVCIGIAVIDPFSPLPVPGPGPGPGNVLSHYSLSNPVWIPYVLPTLFICLAPAIAIALTEQSRLVPSVCKPFVRFGWFGRLAGRFLYPGWPSGVFFTGLLGILLAVFVRLAYRDYDPDTQQLVLIFSWFGTLLFPALVVIPFARKLRSMITSYILIGFASGIFTGLLAILAGVMGRTHSAFLWFFFWLPPVHVVLGSYSRDPSTETVLVLSVAWNILLLLILIVFAAVHNKSISHTEHSRDQRPETRGQRS